MNKLQDITGQESGIVQYCETGETIICNWTQFGGLPRVFATGIIGLGEEIELREESQEVENVASKINLDKIIYDRNGDAETLGGTPATAYHVLSGKDEAIVYAPEGWN